MKSVSLVATPVMIIINMATVRNCEVRTTVVTFSIGP